MRVAITYANSLALGGAERVLDVLARMFPEAHFFSLMTEERFIPEALKEREITTSFLDRFEWVKRSHRSFLPLYPLAVESLNLRGYELIITADGTATKGVITDHSAVQVCYCHSPHRSLWDQYASYLDELSGARRRIFMLSAHYVRQWDYLAAQRVDAFVANSRYIQERIRKYYRRDSTIIFPPVDTSDGYVTESHGDYYLTVGRLVDVKRMDLLIAACNRLRRQLVIVGRGPCESALHAVAGPTISFRGHTSDAELRELYARSKALLFAAEEDFGLVPVEAQSYGRPVIAYGRGGAMESVVGGFSPELQRDGRATGVFFDEQSVDGVVKAILHFEAMEQHFVPSLIREHAKTFDTTVFCGKMLDFVQRQVELRKGGARLPLLFPPAQASLRARG
jgi:glycosyltransferase involved in cell wall biosynthesis